MSIIGQGDYDECPHCKNRKYFYPTPEHKKQVKWPNKLESETARMNFVRELWGDQIAQVPDAEEQLKHAGKIPWDKALEYAKWYVENKQ